MTVTCRPRSYTTSKNTGFKVTETKSFCWCRKTAVPKFCERQVAFAAPPWNAVAAAGLSGSEGPEPGRKLDAGKGAGNPVNVQD